MVPHIWQVQEEKEMITHIVFDIGGVLIITSKDRVAQHVKEHSPLPVVRIKELLFNSSEHDDLFRGTLSPAGYFDYVKEVCRYEGRYEDFLNAWKILPDPNGPNPEIQEIIKQLVKETFLSLLSNTEPTIYEEIKNYPVLSHFPVKILSHEKRAIKPDPRIYQILLKELDVEANQCFFIDDKLENVEAAKEMGMDAIQFLNVEQLKTSLRKRGFLKN
jgi:HAD superfamily hydrolase (TIGR01509 family)